MANSVQLELKGVEKTRATLCGAKADILRTDMATFFQKNKKYPATFDELRKLNLPDHRDPLNSTCESIFLLPLTAKKYLTGLSDAEGFLIALRPLPLGGLGWDCIFSSLKLDGGIRRAADKISLLPLISKES